MTIQKSEKKRQESENKGGKLFSFFLHPTHKTFSAISIVLLLMLLLCRPSVSFCGWLNGFQLSNFFYILAPATAAQAHGLRQ